MMLYVEPALDPPYDHEDRCPVCGANLEWQECDAPGCDDGYITNLHELDPMWYDEGDAELCDQCEGVGGYPVCPNAHKHPKDATP